MKKYRLSDLMPPWVEAPNLTLFFCLIGLGGAAAASFFLFSSQFEMALDMLYTGFPKESPLRRDAQMGYFVDLIGSHGHVSNFFSDSVFFPFILLFLGLLGLAAHYFLGFRNGSKTYYLMRRLPDKWEYLRRCLALPMLIFLLSLVLMPLLTGLFYTIYIRYTPEQCLRPDQWEQFRAHVTNLFLPNLNRG